LGNPGLLRSPARLAAVGIGVFTAAYFLVAAGLLRRWLREAKAPGPLEPVTFFRPLKPGEPGLARSLEVFLEGVEPGDRILFGTSGGEGRDLCAALARKFPDLDIPCPPPGGGARLNPKIEKLVRLEPLATHDRWIVLDSDTMADGAFLRSFRREWQESAVAAFSAPYVFEEGGSLTSRLDAAGTELALWPGVALLRAAGRMDFLTGACMAVKGSVLRRLGGWEAFAGALADDHELGLAVSRSGGRVGMSRCVLKLAAPSGSTRDWLLHQHRAFATFRRCNPGGSLGLPLTFGLALSFFSALAKPLSLRRWALHLALLACRRAAAGALPGRRTLLAVWLSGLAEPAFWLAALLPLPVRWAGKWIPPRTKI